MSTNHTLRTADLWSVYTCGVILILKELIRLRLRHNEALYELSDGRDIAKYIIIKFRIS